MQGVGVTKAARCDLDDKVLVALAVEVARLDTSCVMRKIHVMRSVQIIFA